jgi:hypothetical protein
MSTKKRDHCGPATTSASVTNWCSTPRQCSASCLEVRQGLRQATNSCFPTAGLNSPLRVSTYLTRHRRSEFQFFLHLGRTCLLAVGLVPCRSRGATDQGLPHRPRRAAWVFSRGCSQESGFHDLYIQCRLDRPHGRPRPYRQVLIESRSGAKRANITGNSPKDPSPEPFPTP